MGENSDQHVHLPRIAVKVLAALGAVVLFFAVASVIDPDSSTASDSPGDDRLVTPNGAQSERPRPESRPTPELPSLGVLLGTEYEVHIFSGESGPLYSVFRLDGTVVIEKATEQQVYETVPDLDLRNLVATQIGEVDVDFDHPF